MELFLQVLGVLFLLFLLLIIGGFFLIRYKLKRAIGGFIKGVEAMAPLPPPRITLTRQSTLEWQNAATIEEMAQALRERGFQDAGTFDVEELPVQLQGFAHPSTGLYAVVYQHPQAGIFADVMTEYSDGGALTVTSAPSGHELEQRPGHDKIYLRGASMEELLARLSQERRNEPSRPVSAEGFKSRFEQFYAEEMEWRYNRGGATEDEIRRIAQESGIEASDEMIAQQLEMNQRQAAAVLSEKLQQEFLEKGTLSAAQWEKARDRLVIIHERMTRQMVEEVVLKQLEEDEDDEDFEKLNTVLPTGLGLRESFRLLNERLPSSRRLEKIDELEGPVCADIYLMREEDENK